ncbi:MAG: hypothetical protein F6K30_07655 [Cyanothece sp. SIO2G6]|nr:hypothetical protein [Cyanothece sp. SIO2G6]
MSQFNFVNVFNQLVDESGESQVLFINGMFTTPQKAEQQAADLNSALKSGLFHSP